MRLRQRGGHQVSATKEEAMKKVFAYGGVAASLVLMAFGIGSLVVGFNGRSEVRDNIARESIVGSPDMTPSGIKAEAQKAGLTVASLDIPSMSVAGKEINTGDEAKAFAAYMRIHTLEATGGYTYAEMGRFQAKPGAPATALAKGGGTDDDAFALIDPKTKQPVANPARNIWVTETALTTALNTSFFAERVAVWSIVMGTALLLTGIGFLVLTLAGALGAVPVPAMHLRRQTTPTTT
jgi:hypothetical protein